MSTEPNVCSQNGKARSSQSTSSLWAAVSLVSPRPSLFVGSATASRSSSAMRTLIRCVLHCAWLPVHQAFSSAQHRLTGLCADRSEADDCAGHPHAAEHDEGASKSVPVRGYPANAHYLDGPKIFNHWGMRAAIDEIGTVSGQVIMSRSTLDSASTVGSSVNLYWLVSRGCANARQTRLEPRDA